MVVAGFGVETLYVCNRCNKAYQKAAERCPKCGGKLKTVKLIC